MKKMFPSKDNQYVVFASYPKYAPVEHFINLLVSLGNCRVQGRKRPDAVVKPSNLEKIEWSNTNLTSKQEVKEIFPSYQAMIMFVMPADFHQVAQMTRTFLDVASESGIKRLAWVAPACPEASDLGKRLFEAEALVRSSNLETLVLRHAPLFSDLLDQKKEIKFRRTLSLPLNSSALPWLAPEVIAEGLCKWLSGEVSNNPPDVLTRPVQLKGEEIARELSETLRQNLNGYRFAQRGFDAIDVDQSGQIDKQELFPYLFELGYSQDEAQQILDEADTDKSGLIEFDEFIHGLEEHLNKILAEVPKVVHYFNVPQSAALYDMMTGGVDGNTAKSRLDLLSLLNESGLPEKEQELAQWLGKPSISLADWADKHGERFFSGEMSDN